MNSKYVLLLLTTLYFLTCFNFQYGADPNFSLQSSNVDSRFGGYSGSQGSNMDMGSNGLDSQGGIPRGGANTGSTALYHHHGSRYGLGAVSNGSSAPNGQAGSRMVSSGSSVGGDSKIGLHGSKHKRGDIDRECEYLTYLL